MVTGDKTYNENTYLAIHFCKIIFERLKGMQGKD